MSESKYLWRSNFDSSMITSNDSHAPNISNTYSDYTGEDYEVTKSENFFNKQNIERMIVDSKIVPCLRGLKNHGNTDYFNTLMQCLAGCDRFAEFLLCNDFVNYEKNIIFNSFVKTIRCMWFNNNSTDEFCHKTV
uniref:Peptidase C19 ubiquitin carboxyl-terminal hydrolase domain-containing protein n=1 Tax=Meloidogyne enterolobii TaxID=390850 RepID=A0A6V7XMA1_MELEN|nr:unnamed protein product [Meloidogyne enterolobii]